MIVIGGVFGLVVVRGVCSCGSVSCVHGGVPVLVMAV